MPTVLLTPFQFSRLPFEFDRVVITLAIKGRVTLRQSVPGNQDDFNCYVRIDGELWYASSYNGQPLQLQLCWTAHRNDTFDVHSPLASRQRPFHINLAGYRQTTAVVKSDFPIRLYGADVSSGVFRRAALDEFESLHRRFSSDGEVPIGPGEFLQAPIESKHRTWRSRVEFYLPSCESEPFDMAFMNNASKLKIPEEFWNALIREPKTCSAIASGAVVEIEDLQKLLRSPTKLARNL